MVDSWKIWKEEFDAIAQQEMEEGITKESARRLLIFTEGFMMKVFKEGIENLSDETMEILMQIREKNLLMMEKRGGKE